MLKILIGLIVGVLLTNHYKEHHQCGRAHYQELKNGVILISDAVIIYFDNDNKRLNQAVEFLGESTSLFSRHSSYKGVEAQTEIINSDNRIAVAMENMAPYSKIILKLTNHYDLPKQFIIIAFQESNFERLAISSSQAKGILQLKSAAISDTEAKYDIDCEDIFSVEVNLLCGLGYLKILSDQFGSNLIVLASFKEGRSRVSHKLLKLKNQNKPANYLNLMAVLDQATKNYIHRFIAYQKSLLEFSTEIESSNGLSSTPMMTIGLTEG
jgi:hypothetical protein